MLPTLHKLCLRGADIEEIKLQILLEGMDSVSPTRDSSALHFACLSDNLPIITLLLDYDAPINHRNAKGETPLHYAARQASSEVISYLLEKGADPSLIDNGMIHPHCFSTPNQITNDSFTKLEYNTPLHWAAEDRERDIIELLSAHTSHKLRNNDERTPLETAIYFGNYEGVLALSGDMDNNTLAYAVDCEQCDILQLLLVLGADINSVGNQGKTALQLAVEHRNPKICKSLTAFLHSTPQSSKILSPRSHKFLDLLVSRCKNIVYSH